MQHNFPFSTIKTFIDTKEYKAANHILYNGVMINDVPNFAFIYGYSNAAWTLKADIACLYFTKLVNYMKSNNVSKVVPKKEADVTSEVFNGGLSSGYISRAKDVFPKQGDKFPWRDGANYILDFIRMTFGGLSKDSLEFTMMTTNKKH